MLKSKFVIDQKQTMYPSMGHYLDINELGDLGYVYTQALSTCYGVVLGGKVTLPDGNTVKEKEYFSFWSNEPVKLDYTGKLIMFTRIGFMGQSVIGGPIEDKGRLSYIDGCSDTILVYPPRMGDPSLNYLYFPPNITQSFHTHPTIRLGVVVNGSGYASLSDNEDSDILLSEGDMFCLEPQELHRFRTTKSHMRIVVYHPDGDWGPTDHNHIMLNRTYLTK